jgi:stearoyl-CoA desaturase (delta-9 desaturase)
MKNIKKSATSSPEFILSATLKQITFWLIHLGCFLVIWCGFSWTAVAVCALLYFVRMFGITAAYHRYFSHRSYKTSRAFQFCLAWLGASSAQKGPIWWASHHRHHHQHSDTDQDIHTVVHHGVWWAHVGWVVSNQYVKPRLELVKDLMKFPELCWIDRYHLVPPIVLCLVLYGTGMVLEANYPSLGTSGLQLLVWGFCISTTLLYHCTFLINSACHLFGSKRFETGDESRNSLILALITLGEGWHNNHHRYPGSERQGFYWWEIDIAHYVLKVFEMFGLVWDLRTPPERIYQEAENNRLSLKAKKA